ncbi:phage tail spike protein, partial [Bacillus pseudomycoides]
MIQDQLHIIDFQSEKVVGVINGEHYWGDLRHWELQNNIDTFEFKISTLSEYMPLMQQQNIILKEVSQGRFIPYMITETEVNSHKKELTVYTAAEWIRLGKDAIIKPQELPQMSTYEMLQICLQETDWIAGNAEFNGLHGMKIEKFISPLEMIKEMCKLYELEVEYRARIGRGSQIVRSVNMMKKRGRYTGKEIVLGKDLIGVRRIENTQNICTALVPFVKKGDGTLLTIETVNYWFPYIVDAASFQRWSVRGKHKFGFYEPQLSDEDMSPQRLLSLARTELKKRIKASVTYEVEAQSVEMVFGMDHEKIAEGDTIYIKDHGYTPTLILEARVLAGDHSRTEPNKIKYLFGDFVELTDPQEALRRMYERILAQLNNKASKELTDKLDELIKEAEKKANQAKEESQAAKTLAEMVIENLDNYQTAIQESANPPIENLKPGITLWNDISKGKPGILKKWSGTEWEPLIPDIGKDIKELDERTAEIKSDVKGLTSTVDQLSLATTEQGKQILEANTKIEQTSQKIEAKVDIKQVEDYVGGIGNINLIRNSRFTQETKYWGYWTADNSPMVIDKNTTFSGDFSCKLSCYGQTSLVYSSFTSNRIPVQPGEDVVISAYFMTKNTDEHYNKKIRMVPIFWKSDGTQLKAAVNDFTIPNDMWVRQSHTLKAPDEAAHVGLRAYVLQNGTFWMAHPMLQKSNKASSYLENPNDIVDKDKIMDDLADKVATQDYNKKMTEVDNKFTITQEGLDLRAKKTEVYTKTETDGTFAKDAYVKSMEGRLQVTEKEITSTVRKGDIISAINQTAEKITIDVAKLEINADTVVKWLTAKGINADVINITGDKVRIDKNGVSVKFAEFLVEDSWGKQYSVIPRSNLITDHSFSHMSLQPIDAHFHRILYSPEWKIYGSPVIENPYSPRNNMEFMVNAMRINNTDWIRYNVIENVRPGMTYTFSATFRATQINGYRVTATPTIRVVIG